MEYLTSVDCGNSVCDENVVFKEVCEIYTGAHCNVPCDLSNCTIEIEENTLCPVWVCTDKTTTSSPWTTLTPAKSSDFCSSSPTCITSLTFNGLLILFAVFGLIVFIYKKRQFSRFQPFNDLESQESSQNESRNEPQNESQHEPLIESQNDSQNDLRNIPEPSAPTDIEMSRQSVDVESANVGSEEQEVQEAQRSGFKKWQRLFKPKKQSAPQSPSTALDASVLADTP